MAKLFLYSAFALGSGAHARELIFDFDVTLACKERAQSHQERHSSSGASAGACFDETGGGGPAAGSCLMSLTAQQTILIEGRRVP